MGELRISEAVRGETQGLFRRIRMQVTFEDLV